MESLSFETVLIRLSLTLIATGLVGYDRLKSGQNAGIRTHALVGVGSCVIALIQINLKATNMQWALENPDFASLVNTDSSRLIAQVISGIGFLGAGTIIVTNNVTISGLTTAASLWTVAAIGIAFGLGFWEIGLIGTLFILLALISLNKFRKNKIYVLEIFFDQERKHLKDLYQIFEAYNLKVNEVKIKGSRDNKDFQHYQFFLEGDKFQVDIDQITLSIRSKVENVIEIDFHNNIKDADD